MMRYTDLIASRLEKGIVNAGIKRHMSKETKKVKEMPAPTRCILHTSYLQSDGVLIITGTGGLSTSIGVLS
jgi:hypothetical protein